jgi:hypothetical protein
MTIRVGDFYSINLNEARYMNIMRVDKAIAQCINIEYGNSFDNPFQIEKHCNYIFLVDYLSDDEYHREKIILTQSELKSITGKVSEKEFMQLTRDKKLKELGI